MEEYLMSWETLLCLQMMSYNSNSLQVKFCATYLLITGDIQSFPGDLPKEIGLMDSVTLLKQDSYKSWGNSGLCRIESGR